MASPTVTGDLLLQNPSGSQPTLRLSEDPDNGTNYVQLQSPASLAANYTLTLPTDDGTSGQVLSTDGSGVLSWANALTNPMDSTGDLIYGGASGVATKLDAGTAGQFLRSNGAAAPDWFYSFNTANINTANTTVTLTASDNRYQVFTSFSTGRTVNLPTTSIAAGEVWVLANTAAFDMTVAASGGSTVDTIQSGFIVLVALQAAPTTPAHWLILDFYDSGSYTATCTDAVTNNATVKWVRKRGMVQMNVQQTSASAGASNVITASATNNPSRIRPTTSTLAACNVRSSGLTEIGTVAVLSSGGMQFFRQSEANYSGTSGIGNDRTTFSYNLST
jgi:hypothetical protein